VVTSELEIIGGGAVAVDTATLRQTAARFVAARAELESVRSRLGALQNMLLSEGALAWDATAAASVLSTQLRETFDGADRIAAALREAAAIYEFVELNAEHRAAVFGGDREAVERLDAARAALRSRYPDAELGAVGAAFERTVMWPSDLVRQATEIGFWAGDELGPEGAIIGGAALGLATVGLASGAGLTGSGRIGAASRLRGDPVDVRIVPVPPAKTAHRAPASLAEVTQRIPGAGDSRVRVERYTMPDGTRQYALYVAGTQTPAVGGKDPWDNRSNAELFTGNRSASYEATAEALAAAGAKPGDVVHAFGHSQGAMITAHLAVEGEYDTRTLVSFGSPVEADVRPSTLSVGVRHTDDPVAALAGGGHISPVGAPGSFVAEREADPAAGTHDGTVPAHRMNAYAETAALIDASRDPRVEGVRTVLRDLDTAVAVDVVEYAAVRGK
jgi:pimeloyl-ACP methyl ester carboxylesterase